MVGSVDSNQEKIRRVLKVFILKEREKERQNEEEEAEKTRKKKEHDEKKLKEEEECKSIETKLTELSKRRDKLQQNKNKILDHLKKVRDAEHPVQIEDLTKLYHKGAAETHVSNASSSPSHSVTAPVTIPPRVSAVSIVNNQYKTTNSTPAKVHPVLVQKRNRSPSPTIFHRPPYSYKVPAGPHPFQKLDDPRRNHELPRSYLYKQSSAPGSSNYSAFYPPAQSVAYSHPSSAAHSNAPVHSSYGMNRDIAEVLHKSQTHPSTPPQHCSPYPPPPPHLSSLSGSSPSIQSDHVPYLLDHGKSGPSYPDDKYYMMRPGPHMSVHGNVIPIQPPLPLPPPPPSQVSKHGNITSGFSVRSPSGGPMAVRVQPSHHPSHHSPQTHHARSQLSPVPHIQGLSHHQPSAVHYPPPLAPLSHTQSQFHHSSSVPSRHHHQPPSHIQQLHVQSHHRPPPGSHLQIVPHQASPSIHHSSSQHLQQTIRHQQALPHSQSLHHQPHVQHIFSQGQQSQPTSAITSQAYVNQLNAMEQGNRVVYSRSHSPPR